MASLHTEDTFMWENALIDDYDKDYAPGLRICIDDATPAEWDALADRRLTGRGVDTPQDRSLKELLENSEDWGMYDDKSKDKTALNSQVGGSHYADHAIQPVEFIHTNGLGFCEGNCIKYLCRWEAKGGLQDLEKARHYIDMLIEMEEDKNDE